MKDGSEMRRNKRAIQIEHKWFEACEDLDGDEFKAIFMAMKQYDETGELPPLPKHLLFMMKAFIPYIDDKKSSYEETCKKRAAAGSAGGSTKAKKSQDIANVANVANVANASVASKSKQDLANVTNVAKLADTETETETETETVNNNNHHYRDKVTKNIRDYDDNDVVVVDEDFAELVKRYQDNIQNPIPPMSLEMLEQDIDEFGCEMMKYALEQAVLNSARGYRYIQGIVSNWRTRQIQTLEAAKTADDQYRQRRSPPQLEQPKKPKKRQDLVELRKRKEAELVALYGKSP